MAQCPECTWSIHQPRTTAECSRCRGSGEVEETEREVVLDILARSSGYLLDRHEKYAMWTARSHEFVVAATSRLERTEGLLREAVEALGDSCDAHATLKDIDPLSWTRTDEQVRDRSLAFLARPEIRELLLGDDPNE